MNGVNLKLHVLLHADNTVFLELNNTDKTISQNYGTKLFTLIKLK